MRPRRQPRQPKDQGKTIVRGIVVESLPATTFRVRLEKGEEILAYLSGKMRIHYIKILPGDTVTLELSEDGARGRIIRRM